MKLTIDNGTRGSITVSNTTQRSTISSQPWKAIQIVDETVIESISGNGEGLIGTGILAAA